MYRLFEIILAIILVKIAWKLCHLLHQFFFMRRKHLLARYGKDSYALITGASKGQGKQFALQLAQEGFHLILIGSSNTQVVIELLRQSYPTTQVIFIEKDFSRASSDDSFFVDIFTVMDQYDIGILVNNVGYRVGWEKYEEMPLSEMKKTIAVGTMIQPFLIHHILPHFQRRFTQQFHSAIINITAQCTHSTDLFAMNPEISIPYLSVYEASNAFGFYHSNSLYQEIRTRFPYIDFLTITPGAVLTENTASMLENVCFSIKDRDYVRNILNLLGNRHGVCVGALGHGMSDILINLVPCLKPYILHQVGYRIATAFQRKYSHNKE